MLNEMRERRARIAALEEKYNIRVIRLSHEENQIQLDGSHGFGKLSVENELIDVNMYEEYIYHAILTEGTRFIYLERQAETDDNN